jgi:hypothetical protein
MLQLASAYQLDNIRLVGTERSIQAQCDAIEVNIEDAIFLSEREPIMKKMEREAGAELTYDELMELNNSLIQGIRKRVSAYAITGVAERNLFSENMYAGVCSMSVDMNIYEK